jgi:hypothetical protein
MQSSRLKLDSSGKSPRRRLLWINTQKTGDEKGNESQHQLHEEAPSMDQALTHALRPLPHTRGPIIHTSPFL